MIGSVAIHDQALLERRLESGPWYEEERSQRVIVSLIILAFVACVILPIVDYRHRLSPVPAWASLIGNVGILFSFLAIF
jgi:hypothetical protein